MSKRVENQIKQIYNKVFKQVFTNEVLTDLEKGSRSQVELQIAKIASSQKYQQFCDKFSKELARMGLVHQRGIWRKYYEAARKSHYIAIPHTFSEFEKNIYQKTVINNFDMIKSIPDKIMEVVNHKYTTTLIEEVAEGKLSRGSFKKQLDKHGVTNSKVIARTEAAKLQTIIIENRATDLGSVAYEWLASNDKRTRPSHKNMNGVIVFWRSSNMEKPLLDNMWGNAGEFPNCRCSPEPIFDEDDLTKSNYRVYDYRNHTIIRMTKNELLEALQKGSL